MSKKRILISFAAGLGALAIGFVLFGYYSFTHSFRLQFSPQQMTDIQVALKGAVGEAIFSGQQLKAEGVSAEQLNGKVGLDTLFASASSGNKREGLIDAYRKDPQKFKRYADMLDTAINARRVGDAVLRGRGSPTPHQ